MREILFRGKRKDNGEWVKGFLYKTQEHTYIGYTGNFDDCDLFYSPETIFVEVIPKSVSEFTALTDKNGKKIFEGDIVKHYYLDNNPDVYDIGKIFWNGATCMYLRTCKSGDSYPQVWDSCEYEVIGNIHDNPDLLKGGAE